MEHSNRPTGLRSWAKATTATKNRSVRKDSGPDDRGAAMAAMTVFHAGEGRSRITLLSNLLPNVFEFKVPVTKQKDLLTKTVHLQ